MVRVVHDGLPHFLQQVAGEDEVGESLVGGTHDVGRYTLPLLLSFVDEDDVLADAHDRVHVVGVDNGRDVVFLSDAVQQVVDDKACLRVEAGVGLVAEEVFGVHDDGTGNGDALLHAAGDLTGELVLSPHQIDAVETLHRPLLAFAQVHGRKHVEGKHDVLQDSERVEEGCRLEYHAHFAAHVDFLLFGHGNEVAPVVEYLSAGRLEQSDEILHQHSLAAAALTDDEIGLAVLENGADVFQYIAAVKALV